MESNKHYKNLEAMYLSANINKWYKPSISVGKKNASISIEVDAKFFHAANALHGSVYFKLLDDAAFFAANSVVTDVFVLTTQFSIQLFRPVSSGIITAKGILLFESKNLFSAEAKLFDERNHLLATGTGQFVKSKIQLNDLESYKTNTLI